ncbi:hypothetical protein A6P39_020890 [Streptomyces sp. FXJ1.172]|uniref:hypothetical protein n=1 Tax=Streptomyces sp. FXJ1.172 TaxID=710705 RepID=UPI0023DD3E77|nr:hypothetical protein [Streptomyces sp. FXJ1.172]WEO96288.1 hypothetical protein A6P39_020890 [Streptomyces sp. FXJ1.172]
MLAVAFSTVVAIGALSGLFGARSDAQAQDTTWGVAPRSVAVSADGAGSAHAAGADDTTWG